jgi:solute carrier family 12 (potassium/chloride transporter), member 4/6
MNSISSARSRSSVDRNAFGCDESDLDTVDTFGEMSTDSSGQQLRLFSSPGISGSSQSSSSAKARKLGTINGVFLPCLSSIIGIILFLRLTNITGQAGCIYTTVIVLASTLSTFLTALSLSAIATNGEIQAGGPYYVISRTLGMEIGGSVGLLFYLGTTLATTMYILGAVEAIQRSFTFPFDARIVSLVLIFMVSFIISIGVRYVNMASNFFLLVVVLSIFSYILGASLFAMDQFHGLLKPQDRIFLDNLWPNYQPDPVTGITPNFWSLLAIFYPSVTGILAGSSRSSSLASPSKSIPVGTLGAIGFSTTIYVVTVWLFGLTIANPVLINDKFVIAAVAWPYERFVAVGVIFSSVGAALQTCAGAPRVLSAIAMDNAVPFLGWLKPKNLDAEPTRAIWFTWVLASIPALAGNLDHITPFVTLFFLLMYSGINLSCFFLSFLKSPGFRPTFTFFHWSTSLIGFIWCLALVALVTNMTSVTIVSLLLLFLYACSKKQKAKKEWEDIGNVLRYVIANSALKSLARTQFTDFHAKNWRPQILTIVETDNCGNSTNLHVLTLASQLQHGSGGVHIATSVLHREKGLDNYGTYDLVVQAKTSLKSHMTSFGLEDGFAQVIATSESTCQAIWSAVIHAGLGPLSPNAVLMAYPNSRKEDHKNEDYLKTLRGIMNMKMALLVFKGSNSYLQKHSQSSKAVNYIDVWWIVHEGGLLLLLPHILSKHKAFSSTKIRLFVVASSSTDNPERLREAVVDHLQKVRIAATVKVVDLSDTTIAEDMREVDQSVNHAHPFTTQEVSSHHLTVGEVFAHHAYDIPYQPVMEDEETGDSFHDGIQPIAQANLTQLNSKPWLSHVERMRNASAFNKVLRQNSNIGSLIVTNLPLMRLNDPVDTFFDFVDAMTDGFQDVLFIRGSGIEVITTYA